MHNFKRPALRAVGFYASILGMTVGGTAVATENGNQHYPIGVQTANPALLPPPGGTEFYNYTAYIVGRQFNDNNGHSEIPDFHLSVFAEAPRVIHTWETTVGAIHFSSGGAINLVDTRLDLPGGESFHSFTLGDIDFQPLYATYNTQTLHVLVGPNIWAPIGNYSVDNPASPGFNYWTIAPEIGVTWFPSKRMEVSVDSLTEFNTRNNKTQYHSGNDFDIDYVLAYRPLDDLRWQFGIQGYLYNQWTDDRKNGQLVPDHRGQVYAVGPQIRWDIIPHGGVLVKWQHEMDVRNRPEGERIWIELAAPL
jgi:hypothetical protein